MKNNKGEDFTTEMVFDNTVEALMKTLPSQEIATMDDFEKIKSLVGSFNFHKQDKFSFKNKIELVNLIWMTWVTARSNSDNLQDKSEKEYIDLYEENKDLSKKIETMEENPFAKYIQKKLSLSQSQGELDEAIQLIPDYKIQRMTGKLMQVIEMLPLDDQKQKATKQILKDYIYDAVNNNASINSIVYDLMVKDGLPVEENVFA